MKKKKITYGVSGMMEYQAVVKIGKATMKVPFSEGSMTAMGVNPAKFTTDNFVVQHAIEQSGDFRRGRIHIVSVIELDEEVKIEGKSNVESRIRAGAGSASDTSAVFGGQRDQAIRVQRRCARLP